MTAGARVQGPPAARRAAPSLLALRWRVARLIARQEVRDTVFGWPFYLTAAAGLILSVMIIYNSLRFVAESGLLILSRPFYFPLLVTTSLAMLYLLAWAALAVARPRDQGALRVLFFAPVDAVALVGGHLLAGLAVYSLLLLLTVPLLWALALLVNLPFPPALLVGLLASLVFVAAAVALGLFLSTVAPSSRGAMFFFVGMLLLLLAVQLGHSALLNVPPASNYYDTLRFLREALGTIRGVLGWVSPFGLLSEGLDAALRAGWRDLLLRVAAGIAGCAVWLGLAIWGLMRRGVLP